VWRGSLRGNDEHGDTRDQKRKEQARHGGIIQVCHNGPLGETAVEFPVLTAAQRAEYFGRPAKSCRRLHGRLSREIADNSMEDP
jgi:hypothetical protein